MSISVEKNSSISEKKFLSLLREVRVSRSGLLDCGGIVDLLLFRFSKYISTCLDIRRQSFFSSEIISNCVLHDELYCSKKSVLLRTILGKVCFATVDHLGLLRSGSPQPYWRQIPVLGRLFHPGFLCL